MYHRPDLTDLFYFTVPPRPIDKVKKKMDLDLYRRGGKVDKDIERYIGRWLLGRSGLGIM